MVKIKRLPAHATGVTMPDDFECPSCSEFYDRDEEVFYYETPSASLACDFCGYMTGHTIETD